MSSKLSEDFFLATVRQRYSYRFSALGRPIIQYPTDMVGISEIMWKIRPTLVIETGIAHGGSIVQSAANLALLDYDDAHRSGSLMSPHTPNRRVIAVDIDIRDTNRMELDRHCMRPRITLIEGSSAAEDVIESIKATITPTDVVLVILDSNHTHHHVLAELEAYAPLVSVGSYCIVLDTVIEDMPAGSFPDRPWDKGNNPKTAVWEFLKSHPEFEIDASIPEKLLVTVAPDGYLKRVS